MSYLNILKKSRDSDITVLQYFLLHFKRKEKCIHAFFEGRDDPSFYTNYFENNLPKNYVFKIYKCNNKKSVYYIYHQLKARNVPKELSLYFVDKDLSDYLGEEWDRDVNIFTTKYYSIENYMVNKTVLKRILIELYGINESDATIEFILENFEIQLNRFYKLFIPLYAYIILKKLEGYQILFNNINLHKIFLFNDKAVIKKDHSGKQKIKLINQVCSINATSIKKNEFRKLINVLKSNNPKTYIRGKFELWFLVLFVKNIFILLTNNGMNYKTKIELGKNNATEILGPRVKQPKELKYFFKNIFSELPS
jgi:hypothetical protein